MDIETIIREARADQLRDVIGLQTEAGKKAFGLQLRQYTSSLEAIQRRQRVVLQMRAYLEAHPESNQELGKIFEELKSLEKECQVFEQRTPVETDSFEQLLFSHYEPLRILNTIPFLLMLVALYKQYLVPLMALCSPLFILIGPYLLIRYWYKTPISVQMYTKILMDMLGLKSQWDLKQIAQLMMTFFTLVQGIYQPIMQSYHLQKIDTDIQAKGHIVEKVGACYERLRQIFPEDLRPGEPLLEGAGIDARRHFATVWDNPFLLRYTWSSIGDCEVLYRIALSPLKPVRLLAGDSSEPCLILRGGSDPFLPPTKRVPFHLRLVPAGHIGHHCLLTGPNRGGKSSTLRTTLLAVYLAQTFGLSCFEETMILRPFHWIATGLRLEDRPGHVSMFESEVEFAQRILQRARHAPNRRGLVLFDELFHSTNPPDGKYTADVFLSQLWKCPNLASFISTHVFSLVEKAPKNVQRLCTYAYRDEQQELHLTYTLQPGLCTESTVDFILREKGLLSRKAEVRNLALRKNEMGTREP